MAQNDGEGNPDRFVSRRPVRRRGEKPEDPVYSDGFRIGRSPDTPAQLAAAWAIIDSIAALVWTPRAAATASPFLKTMRVGTEVIR